MGNVHYSPDSLESLFRETLRYIRMANHVENDTMNIFLGLMKREDIPTDFKVLGFQALTAEMSPICNLDQQSIEYLAAIDDIPIHWKVELLTKCPKLWALLSPLTQDSEELYGLLVEYLKADEIDTYGLPADYVASLVKSLFGAVETRRVAYLDF